MPCSKELDLEEAIRFYSDNFDELYDLCFDQVRIVEDEDNNQHQDLTNNCIEVS